jgi:outer membrane protein
MRMIPSVIVRRAVLPLLLTCLAPVGPARAQNGQAPLAAASARPVQLTAQTKFDLSRCLDLALKNSHRRKTAASSTDVARAQLGQAMSSRYPEVSAGVTFTRLDEDPNFVFPASSIAVPAMSFQTPPLTFTLPGNALGPGLPPVNVQLPIPGQTVSIPAQVMQVPEQNVKLMDRNLLTGSLGAFYPLYTGGLAGARIAQAKAGVDASRHEQRRTDLEVAYDVKRAYYAVVLTGQLTTLGRDTLARMEATLELTQNLYKTGSGRVKKTDYLRNLSMVESIRAMVADLESQQHIARAGLEAAVEWDAPTPIEVADEELAFVPIDARVETAIERAYSASPDIGRLQAGLAAAKAGIDAANSGRLPKVGLFANLHLVGNSYNLGVVTPENKTTWAAGVGAEWPLFQGFRVINEVRAARAGHEKLQGQLALLREGIRFEVKRTCYELEQAQARQKASGEAYRAASENRELNIRAYQEDLVETKDVIEAQLMEALLAAQHFKVLYDNLEAQARLERILGQSPSTVPGRQ